MEYIADSVALGYVFLRALHVFHDSYHSTNAPKSYFVHLIMVTVYVVKQDIVSPFTTPIKTNAILQSRIYFE